MRRYATLFAALLGGCASGPLADPHAADPHTADARVDALMREYAGHRPGAAVLVLRDGTPLLRRGYGLADVEAGTPVTPETAFRLASVTKQFTAAAILLLVQDGVLSLDDPVQRWLPSLPPATRNVTLHHLLAHGSGLVDYEDLMPDAPDTSPPVQVRDADVLRLLEGADRTWFPPGTGYRYSNSGYALLALVVGKASGRDFAGFLRQRIFAPLGMHAVAYEAGISTVPERAYGYSRDAARWTRTDQSSTSAVLGDGGIYASIDDLAKWNAALDDDRLLSDALRADAFAAHNPVRDEPDVDAYGYGWRIRARGGESLRWHSGETIGFRNVVVRWPERRLVVVVLTNRNAPEPYALALKIGALYR